jgi:hypothetical protein
MTMHARLLQLDAAAAHSPFFTHRAPSSHEPSSLRTECGTPCYGPASHAAARSLLFPISAFELWILFFIGSRLNHCGCPKLGFLLYIVGPHTWKETIMFVDLLLTCASCIPQEDSHERSTPRGTVMLCILTFEPRA